MGISEKPSKEQIIEYCINQVHTINECCSFFKIGKTKFYKYLKEYNIVRSKDDKSKIYSKTQNSIDLKNKIKSIKTERYGNDNFFCFISDDFFSIKGKEYSVKWFTDEYCNNNIPLSEMCKKMQISTTIFYQICKKYNINKTNEKRYENIKKTVVNKYGVVSTLQLNETKEKSKETCIKKYGTDNVMKSNIIKEKLKKTNNTKYNVDNFSQCSIQHFDIWESKEKIEQFILSFGNKKPSVYDLSQYFNVSVSGLRKHIHQLELDDLVNWYYARSHYEDNIIEYLQNEYNIYNIIQNDKKVLDGQEIDIYLPDYKMGIEFNGNYWHSDIYYNDHNGRSTYHQKKSLLAEAKGIFLFHIFEYEWDNIKTRNNILSRLKTLLNKNEIKISGRECQVIELTKEQKKDFLDINHIQKNDHSIKQYGLLYNNEIVACMTFTRPKNNKYTWELSRFCNKHNYIVRGGASKLFQYFLKTLNIGDTVSSYNDITKTKGNLYEILGFTCISINQPNYVWINFQTDDVRTRYQEQKAGEIERMHNQGYHRVCDCGTKTWVYTKNSI